MNDQLQVLPQKTARFQFEDENRTCIIAIRADLTYQDGKPVRAHDCGASLSRWMKRSPPGIRFRRASMMSTRNVGF